MFMVCEKICSLFQEVSIFFTNLNKAKLSQTEFPSNNNYSVCHFLVKIHFFVTIVSQNMLPTLRCFFCPTLYISTARVLSIALFFFFPELCKSTVKVSSMMKIGSVGCCSRIYDSIALNISLAYFFKYEKETPT